MIKFWRTSGKYGCFSNFARFHIILDGKRWETSEHYYQAQKTQDPELQEKIRSASTPKQAKIIASKCSLRKDWEQIKLDVMKKAIRAKVDQHRSIRELLMESGNEDIAEDSPYDYIWGLGQDGSGQNLLGKVWMEVRREIDLLGHYQ